MASSKRIVITDIDNTVKEGNKPWITPPVEGMPDMFRSLEVTFPGTSFAYLTNRYTPLSWVGFSPEKFLKQYQFPAGKVHQRPWHGLVGYLARHKGHKSGSMQQLTATALIAPSTHSSSSQQSFSVSSPVNKHVTSGEASPHLMPIAHTPAPHEGASPASASEQQFDHGSQLSSAESDSGSNVLNDAVPPYFESMLLIGDSTEKDATVYVEHCVKYPHLNGVIAIRLVGEDAVDGQYDGMRGDLLGAGSRVFLVTFRTTDELRRKLAGSSWELP